MNAPATIEQLAAAWRAAKDDETAANARRIEIEQMIVAAMPASSPESIEKRDVGGLQVKVTYKVARSVDSEKLSAVWMTLPDKAQTAFRWKAEPKMRELRALQEYLPDEYKRLAAFIETKPAKPSVSVEEAA